MKQPTVKFTLAVCLVSASHGWAQDTRYRAEHQQIPTSACLVMRGAWEGGSKPCTGKLLGRNIPRPDRKVPLT